MLIIKMAALVKASPPYFQNDPYLHSENRVVKALVQVSSQATNFFRFFGTTIFTVDSSNQIRFSFCSPAITLVILRFVLTLVVRGNHNSVDKMMRPLLHALTETEEFVSEILHFNIVFADIISLMFLFTNRSEIIRFQRNLTSLLVALTSDSEEVTDLCISGLRGTNTKILSYRRLIFGIMLFNMAGFAVGFTVIGIMTPELLHDPFYFVVPFFFIFWVLGMNVLYIAILWVLSLLFVVTQCAYLLRIKMERMKLVVDNQKEAILELWSQLETLIGQFNRAFGYAVSAYLLSFTITSIMYAFQLCMRALINDFRLLPTCLINLTMNLSALYYVCDGAGLLELEVISNSFRSLKLSIFDFSPVEIV